MRVLHVAESTAGGLGGYLDSVVRAGRDRGFDVHVSVPTADLAGERFTAAGAAFHGWECTAQPGPQVIDELRRLRRIVAEVDPDVVHLHSSKAGLIGRLAVRRRRATVFQPHSWSFTAVSGRWAAGALRWERFGARWADVVLCVSEAERRIARDVRLDARLVVVPNGVDLTRFAYAGGPARAAARERLRLGDGAVAVCVGRLHRQKNQAALLQAWPSVRAAVPDARLLLVGDGPDADRLAAQGVEGVILVGHVDDPRDYYAAADVVVQPSRWEGMSLAVLEALASGRSVVATDVTGMSEIVEPSALVPPEDEEALVKAVVQRLTDSALATAEGERGRARVSSAHDVRAHVKTVLDLEEELARNRAGA